MAAKTIALVTGNQGKLREVQHYFADAQNISITSVKMDLTEIQAATTLEVSKAKAIEAFWKINGQSCAGSSPDAAVGALVDDTALGADVLNGLPGPYIKWFLESLGSDNIVRLTEGFRSAVKDDMAHRRATASCVFSYCYGLHEGTGEPLVEQFVGSCPGMFVLPPRGDLGFGWDNIFAPEEQATPFEKTFAEMTVEEKNKISHRAQALARMKEYLESH